MRKVSLKEDEKKYIASLKKTKLAWDKEMIICQWYVEQTQEYEKKHKLILDFSNLQKKYVIVEKMRTSITASDKTVSYLSVDELDVKSFLNTPFIMKRRSIKNNAHLDHFIFSNQTCEYLLELEDDLSYKEVESDIELIDDVSDDLTYRNINMAIPFEKLHIEQLCLLLELWK